MSVEERIEDLAIELAISSTLDFIMSDRWYGYPDGHEEQVESVLQDFCNSEYYTAKRYAFQLGLMELTPQEEQFYARYNFNRKALVLSSEDYERIKSKINLLLTTKFDED